MEMHEMMKKLTVHGLKVSKMAIDCINWKDGYAFTTIEDDRVWWQTRETKSGKIFDNMILAVESAFIHFCNNYAKIDLFTEEG